MFWCVGPSETRDVWFIRLLASKYIHVYSNQNTVVRFFPSERHLNSSPKWTVPFRNDFIKAIKWFQQGLDWKPPHVIYHPSAQELREFLWQPNVNKYMLNVGKTFFLGHSKKYTCFSSPSHERYDEGASFFFFIFC